MDHFLLKAKARIIITAVILCVVVTGYAQCTGCTGNISTGVGSYTINPGQTLCLASGVTYNGSLVLNGGTLCSAGTIKNITFLSGTFRNYGTYNPGGNLTISPSGNVTIENYNASFFTVANFVYNGGSKQLVFNSCKGSKTTFTSFLENSGTIVMDIGKSNPESDPDPSSLLTVNGLFTVKSDFNLTMEQNSTGNINNIMSLENTGIKTITNYGTLTLSRELNMISSGSAASVVTINNYSTWSMKALNASYGSGKVFINNYLDDAAVAMGINNLFSVTSDLSLSAVTVKLKNTGIIEVAGNFKMTEGSAENSRFITANSFLISGGTLKNDYHLKATADFSNTNAGITLNNKTISVANSFNNSSTVNLAAESFLFTKNYYNTGAGASITGATADIVESLYPKIVITDASENSALLKERIFIYDASLISDVSTIGYGFDVMSNPANIATTIFFPSVSAAPGTGNPPLVSCASLTSMYKINIIPPPPAPCGRVRPQAQAIQLIPAGATTETVTLSLPSNSYTWQPGGANGQAPLLYPVATTVYTVYATLSNGCVISNTLLVTVSNPGPAIQYNGIVAYGPGSSLTFSVTMTNPISGGTYSSTPTGLSLNSSTGVITASLSSFGTYTVNYTVPAAAGCYSLYVISTVVTLTNIESQCNVNVGFFGGAIEPYLCPGEKIQMVATGSPATYTWAPSVGLSCVNCPNPLLTFTPTQTSYSLSYTINNYVCPAKYLTVFKKQDCVDESIIGCCFSNYGVSVYVSKASTYLNVYCNVLNEVANLVLPNTLSKGKFESTGNITVSKEWIHNGQNKLFEIPYALSQNSLAVPQGTTSFIANTDQNIKGNSSTYFNKLILAGNGKRIIWIDTYSTSDLDLTINEFVLQNFNFLMKNGQSNVFRTSGFASSLNDGYFSRLLASTTSAPNKTYLFPLGSAPTPAVPYRYRPLELMNNKTSVSDEVSANFTNGPASLATDPEFVNISPNVTNNVALTSPNILQRNTAYYHKVKNTQLSAALSNIVLRDYFPAIDGNFNSVSEWEAPPTAGPDWWGITPGVFSNYSVSTNPGTFGQVYAAANGTLTFQGKPFSLATTGVNINTSSFGAGNVITLTSSPSTGTAVTTSSTTTNASTVVNTTTTTVLGSGITTSTVNSSNGSSSTNTVSINSGVTTGTTVNTGPPSVVTYTTSSGTGGITTNTTITVTGTGTTVTTSSTTPTIGGASSNTTTVTNGSTTTTSVSTTSNNGNSSTTTTTITTTGPGGTTVQTQTCVTTTNGTTQVTTCTGAGATTYTTSTNGPNITPVSTYTNVYNPGPIVTSPNPLAADYYLNIASLNSCELPGKVKFSVSPNSIIDPNSVEFYDPTSNLSLGNLSPALFTITSPTLGITLNSTPTEILAACSNSIIIKTALLNDHVISGAGDGLSVYIPIINGGGYATNFTIYNYSNAVQGSPQILSTGSTNAITTTSLVPGVYHFEFAIVIGATNYPIKGQFIKL